MFYIKELFTQYVTFVMKNWEGMLILWAFCSRIGVQEFDILNVYLHILAARGRYCPVLP